MASFLARHNSYVLQAELQFLFVRHEILSHLHCQVVERQNAVKKRQHLFNQSMNDTLETAPEKSQSKETAAIQRFFLIYYQVLLLR